MTSCSNTPTSPNPHSVADAVTPLLRQGVTLTVAGDDLVILDATTNSVVTVCATGGIDHTTAALADHGLLTNPGAVSRRRMLAAGTATAGAVVTTMVLPTASAAASPTPPPDPVTSLALNPVTGDATALQATWTASTGATSYTVQSRKTGDPNFTNPQTTTDTQITLTGLDPDTSYDVEVTATNPGGPSTPQTASATTLPIATGGNIQDINVGGTTYRVHTFTTDDVFALNADQTLEYLIVGGGGGGGGGGFNNQTGAGGDGGGGGGGGGAQLLESSGLFSAAAYPVVVGPGGVGGNPGDAGGAFAGRLGAVGGNSSALGFTAAQGIGGGGGRNPDANTIAVNDGTTPVTGGNDFTGGGGGQSGTGFSGGNGSLNNPQGAQGASVTAAPSNPLTTNTNPGQTSSFFGSPVVYGHGGGGGGPTSGVQGSTAATPGSGGGGGRARGTGVAGQPGIVGIRYPIP